MCKVPLLAVALRSASGELITWFHRFRILPMGKFRRAGGGAWCCRNNPSSLCLNRIDTCQYTAGKIEYYDAAENPKSVEISSVGGNFAK